MIRPFHLAIPVSNLEKSRHFYKDILGCSLGRSSDEWIDFNFFEHQLVIHKSNSIQENKYNSVDGHDVPIPHFGVILDWEQWHKFSNRIKDEIEFVIEPYIRFKGQTGEQATMFFLDPDNNALEFKAFKNDKMIFEK
jgi:extradiol dioxygenase family protein|tara:strand:+ start:54 stop:464 length:411 start_codon:yes stop_codon:yes gene_type:complete